MGVWVCSVISQQHQGIHTASILHIQATGEGWSVLASAPVQCSCQSNCDLQQPALKPILHLQTLLLPFQVCVLLHGSHYAAYAWLCLKSEGRVSQEACDPGQDMQHLILCHGVIFQYMGCRPYQDDTNVTPALLDILQYTLNVNIIDGSWYVACVSAALLCLLHLINADFNPACAFAGAFAPANTPANAMDLV